jgi:hypothetical protein
MPQDLLLASYLVKGTAFITAVALVLRARPKPAPVWLIATAAVVFFAGLIWRLFSLLGFDYQIFWAVGGEIWAGQDPYAADRFAEHPFLHPPTALPFFALFALAPFEVSFFLWTLVNALACLMLLPLAQSALVGQELRVNRGSWMANQPDANDDSRFMIHDWHLPPLVLVGLTPALLVSDASLVSFYLGQLGLIECVILIAALRCQAKGWPILAGTGLALATVKVATMLPFLLLFHRKSDRRAWVALFVTVLGLCLVTASVADLPGRLSTILQRIKQLEAPGLVNDYSFDGPRSENMLGFDHAFYRLGLRDRRLIRVAQYLALTVLGSWVARQVLRKDSLPRAAACSLVALYSVVFLYHRTYDTLILVLPFVYSAGQARSVSGRSRCLFAGCAIAILLVWYLDIGLLRTLREHSLGWGGWGRLVQAVVLPYATWLVVLTMIVLVVATRRAAAAPRPAAGRSQPNARTCYEEENGAGSGSGC